MAISLRYALAGLAAGSITGILGSGGGLILVPLLTRLSKEDSSRVFPYSLSIMLPICLCSLLLQLLTVNNHDDCRGTDFGNIAAALGKLTSQESHGIGFAAACRTKVGTALAAFFGH